MVFLARRTDPWERAVLIGKLNTVIGQSTGGKNIGFWINVACQTDLLPLAWQPRRRSLTRVVISLSVCFLVSLSPFLVSKNAYFEHGGTKHSSRVILSFRECDREATNRTPRVERGVHARRWNYIYRRDESPDELNFLRVCFLFSCSFAYEGQ